MNKKKTMILLLALGFFLYFSGMAIGDGGGPEPKSDCSRLWPATDTSPLIKGFFTAAYDKSQCTVDRPSECRHYDMHFVLEMPQLINGKETLVRHLFSFPMGVCDRDICSYTETELKEKYKYQACNMGIGKAFGLKGVPVITDLSVTVRDFCGDTNDGMIAGTLKIRVVPKQ